MRAAEKGNHDQAIFSKEALAVRKQQGKPDRPDWLDEYLKTSYVPTKEDFRPLRRHVAKYRKIYEAGYREIRHQWYAHKQADGEEVGKLFARTNITEMQRLTAFCGAFHEALWQLFYNGSKPVLKPYRYSVNEMFKEKVPPRSLSAVQEIIAHETSVFLRSAAAKFVSEDQLPRPKPKRRKSPDA